MVIDLRITKVHSLHQQPYSKVWGGFRRKLGNLVLGTFKLQFKLEILKVDV